MPEEDTYEVLIDEYGNVKKGEKGGIKEVFIRLEQIKQKFDEINEKLSEAKIG